jgi:hypothetical protein
MAKTSKKRAKDLTTDEAMNRIFGAGASDRLRAVVAKLDREKTRKKPKKTGRNQPKADGV